MLHLRHCEEHPSFILALTFAHGTTLEEQCDYKSIDCLKEIPHSYLTLSSSLYIHLRNMFLPLTTALATTSTLAVLQPNMMKYTISRIPVSKLELPLDARREVGGPPPLPPLIKTSVVFITSFTIVKPTTTVIPTTHSNTQTSRPSQHISLSTIGSELSTKLPVTASSSISSNQTRSKQTIVTITTTIPPLISDSTQFPTPTPTSEPVSLKSP